MSQPSLAWNKRDLEKMRAYAKAYRARYPDRIKAYWKHYWKSKPEILRAISRRGHLKLRHEVLKAYGNTCRCCGETQPQFLGLDHVQNDGAAHRRKVGSGTAIYNWAKKHGYPKSLQVLCHNCNLAKGVYGQCPHRVGVG